MSKVIARAEWVFPVTSPLIRDGGVVHDGARIIEVGRASELRRKHPDARPLDLGDCLLLPGLVNAHAHLELSDQVAGEPPARFIDWLRRIVGRTADVGEPEVAAAFGEGLRQCVRFGVTTVGDVTRFPAVTRRLAVDARLVRIVSYGEVTAMGRRRELLEERLADVSAGGAASPKLTIGVSPHAPYSVEVPGYRRIAGLGVPVATHLAESPDEAAFLADLSGPFRELWDGLPWFDPHIPTFPGGPIRMAAAVGLLSRPSLLAHVNYCDDAELALLAASPASVVYCPRTHAYFGHPPHRWRAMLAAGINVAVGTDSTASSPDLNLVDDLRLLHRIAPDVPAETLWRMATLNGAVALERPEAGSLEPGKAADFVAFAVRTDDPLREVLEADGRLPAHVTIGSSAGPASPG